MTLGSARIPENMRYRRSFSRGGDGIGVPDGTVGEDDFPAGADAFSDYLSIRDTKELQLNSAIDLTKLNDAQRAAVQHIDGPTLILAGAGSGKTRALTHKIAYLVSKGMPPWSILAVTFTNKAAREMVGRVESLLGIPAKGLWIGTFHGICVRILHREADRWGLKRDFTIYDRDDQMTAVKKAMKEIGVDKNRLNPASALSTISRSKNDFHSPDELNERFLGPDGKLYIEIYRRYNRILRDAGAYDFDDLLAKPVEMFRAHPDILGEWQRRFKHILVDEYQDTNRTQYLLMKLLCGDYGNVTVVGDDDQSIYSWRGANIENILNFEDDFKDAKTIRLEQNYRSTQTILKAANTVVAKNRRRKSKTLWTECAEGDAIEVNECMSDREEAEKTVRSIEKDLREYEYSRNDIVILYRTNAQSRPFEDVLRRKGIPYTIVGGLRFYDRKEIKDLLAYFRFLANHDDAVAFARAISTPKRGIGDKTIETVEQFARNNGITIMDALRRSGEIVGGATLSRLKDFAGLMDRLADIRVKGGLGPLCANLVEEIDFEYFLEKEHPENADERKDNVRELIAAMGDYEGPEGEDPLSAFLAEVSLMTDIDGFKDDVDTVTLMTLHAAKGLEFKSVYIVGVEKGLFPLPSSFEEDDLLEEERRLFYVGVTRAEERLHVSYAQSRARYGSFTGGASMFIKELPEDVINYNYAEVFEPGRPPTAHQPIRRVMEFEDYPQEPEYREESPYRVGSFVLHPKFGKGKITACSGSGDKLVLTIRFGGQTKKIMAGFVQLSPA